MNHRRMSVGLAVGSVHKSACVAKAPWGSRRSTQRIVTGGLPLWYHTAVWEAISTVRAPCPYQSATSTAVQAVVGSAATCARVGRRAPLRRGRPIVWEARGGAGA